MTLCTEGRQSLFGDIIKGVVHLNDMGRAVKTCWRDIPRHFPHAELDEFVIMPKHVHGIIRIVDVKQDELPTVRAVGIPIVPGLMVPDDDYPNGHMRPYMWDVGACGR